MRASTALISSSLLTAICVLISPVARPGQAPHRTPAFAPGGRDELRASPHVAHTFVRNRRRPLGSDVTAGVPGASNVVVNVTYTGFTPQAQAAFQYAVDLWKTELTSSVPVQINAQFAALGTGILGSAGPAQMVRDFTGAPRPGTWYPIALANQLAGTDLIPGMEDIDAEFGSGFSWYFGTDGNAPAGTYDFVSVVLHELGHGLGFLGSGDVASGSGSWGFGSGMPMIYDRFVADASGDLAVNPGLFPNPGSGLTALFESNSLFFNAPDADAAAGAAGARLFAPASWEEGSSYVHLDEATYPEGDPNSLMTPALASAEAIHDPGPIMRGMMADMGWQVPALSACTYAVSPSMFALPASGGSGTFTVTTGPSCNWSTTGAQPWVSFTSATSGTGPGSVTFTVAASDSSNPRATGFLLAGTNVLVSQDGVPCSFTAAPGSDTQGSRGVRRRVQVTATASDCSWTVSANDSWLQVIVATGTGSGYVDYVAQPNASSGPRLGGLVINGTTTQVTIPVRQAGTRAKLVDFNGDGAGDAFLYDPATGAWSMQTSGAGLFSAIGSGTWATGWTITPADFNGDGLTDLFLYNPTSGLFFKAINTGNGQFSFFGYQWASGWVPTVGDFNGDGLSDVFLYNPTSGQWFMCLTVPGASDFSYRAGVWAPGWQISVADFNGDGRTDLFLYNGNGPTDVNHGRWFRVITQPDASFTYLPGDVRWAPGWTITVADFDGDGQSDLFLYNETNGLWFLVQFTAAGETYSGGLWAQGWTIRAGDFDGDGRSDLFLYNATNGRWFIAQTISPGAFGFTSGVWAPGWTVSTTDFNADGVCDLLLYNATDGTWFQVTTLGGAFSYTTGAFPAGIIATASVPEL